MEPRLAELSRLIDVAELGRRLKAARIAAGMTQGQVVADEVSAAYLSRIEDGQRRPEAGLLERMAGRIGVSLESLLEDGVDELFRQERVALDHAELDLATGNAQSALDGVAAVLGAFDKRRPPRGLHDAATLLRARALEATGDLNGAIAILEALVATPNADPSWLKSAIALSRCYREIGDLPRAIATGEAALEKAADLGLDGLTETIQLAVSVAGAHFLRGDLDYALRLCLRALETADAGGCSPIARAGAYWNASVIEASQGSLDSALDFSNRAVAIYEEADDLRALAALRTQAAELQLATDPPDVAAALQILEMAEREMAWSAATNADRADLLVVRVRAHLTGGDVAQAEAVLIEAESIVPDDALFVRALLAGLAGRGHAMRGDMAAARADYRRGVALLTGAGSDRIAGQLWFELANLLVQAGDNDAAVQAFQASAAANGLVPPRSAGTLLPQ